MRALSGAILVFLIFAGPCLFSDEIGRERCQGTLLNPGKQFCEISLFTSVESADIVSYPPCGFQRIGVKHSHKLKHIEIRFHLCLHMKSVNRLDPQRNATATPSSRLFALPGMGSRRWTVSCAISYTTVGQ